MRIVLFGATGNVGRRIAKEALDRGHQVTGLVREGAKVESPDARLTLDQGDATNGKDVARLARVADAAVSAISPRPNARGLGAPAADGKSSISFEDYALALVDKLEQPRHLGRRFGVGY